MCIGLCYYTHIWDDATAQAFVGHLQRILGEMDCLLILATPTWLPTTTMGWN